MNARTSDCPDFVVDENSLHCDFLPDDFITDTYINRCSQDKGKLNSNGRVLLDFCKQTGMRMLNGCFDRDKHGRYTYVGSNGSSVVDYVIRTSNLFQCVDMFYVHDPNILTDHCLIDFVLSFDKADIPVTCINGQDNPSQYVECKYT